jgi:hypothetical protein
MIDSNKKFRDRLEYTFKNFKSITILEAYYYPYAHDVEHMFFIKLLVNENQYIAEVLIHGNILKDLNEQYNYHGLIINWV